MCWQESLSLAGSAVSGVTSAFSGNSATASAIDQSRQQQQQLLKQMNYTDANLKMQQRDLLDTAVSDLTTANMSQVRNMGTIRAAIGEGNIEGNSMDRIQRITEGDAIREQSGITENYKRDYVTLLGQRYSNRDSSVSQIEAMQKAEPKQKSKLRTALDVATPILQKGAELGISKLTSGTKSTPAPITAAKSTKVTK